MRARCGIHGLPGDEVMTIGPLLGAAFRTFYLNSAGLTIDAVRLEGAGAAERPVSRMRRGADDYLTEGRSAEAIQARPAAFRCAPKSVEEPLRLMRARGRAR